MKTFHLMDPKMKDVQFAEGTWFLMIFFDTVFLLLSFTVIAHHLNLDTTGILNVIKYPFVISITVKNYLIYDYKNGWKRYFHNYDSLPYKSKVKFGFVVFSFWWILLIVLWTYSSYAIIPPLEK